MKLSYTTFADKNIKANVLLVDNLLEIGDKNLIRNISSKLQKYDSQVLSLNVISELHYEFYLGCAYTHMVKIISETKYPENIKKLTLSLLSSKYKNKLNDYKLKKKKNEKVN